MYVKGGKKIWRALFSGNHRFEIRPFALLPTNGFVKKTGNTISPKSICITSKEPMAKTSKELLLIPFQI